MALFQAKHINATKSLKSLRYQGLFLKRLGLLLLDGFSIKDALSFLKTISVSEIERWITAIESGLESGSTLHHELSELDFPEKICSQIYFSLNHGRYAETIVHCGDQLIDRMERKKKLQQLLSYPVMLVIFIVGMLFAMRYILLPHIRQITTSQTSHLGFGTRFVMAFIDWSPVLLVGSLVVIAAVFIGAKRYLSTYSELEKLRFLIQIPIIGKMIQLTNSQYLAHEWGQLLKYGVSLKEIITMMQSNKESLFLRELADSMEKKLLEGQSFTSAILSYTFLTEELGYIINHGEMSSDLGKELMLYARQCEEDITLKVEKIMSFIQPIVFIGVAVMIIAIYAALLLPTFSLMEGL